MNRVTEFNIRTKKVKTQILVCDRNELKPPKIILDNDTLQQVDRYKYLGNIK